MNIGIDFDGVIADSTRLKISEAKIVYGVDILPEHCSVETAEKAGLSKEQYRELVRRIYSSDLSLLLDEVPNAKKTIERLSEFHKIYIITSRTYYEIAFVKKWLEIVGFPYDKLVNTNEESKLSVCKEHSIDIFVDDTYKKLVELSGNGLQLYLFSTPTNGSITVEHPDIKRVNDWEELYQILI